MKPNCNLKFDVYSDTFYLWIGILKTCINTKMTFFFANQSQKEKQLAIIGNNADAVLNDFYGLGKQKYLNNVWHNISLDSCDDAIVILQNSRESGVKSQTTYENINHSRWFDSASLYRVLCHGIYCTFFLENYYLNKTKPYFLNG